MNTQKIIDAVVLMRPEELFAILDGKPMPESLLKDVGGFTIPVPIYYFTKCWEYLLKDPWQKKVQKMVNVAKKNNLKIKDYFKESCGIDLDTIEIPFKKFSYEDFYKADVDQTTYEVCGFKSYDDMIAHNILLDCQLYEASEKFDFIKTEELLKQGANPSADIYDGDLSKIPADPEEREEFMFHYATHAWERISDEESFLCCELQDIVLSNECCSKTEWHHHSDLISWTAHAMMENLLKKYIRE